MLLVSVSTLNQSGYEASPFSLHSDSLINLPKFIASSNVPSFGINILFKKKNVKKVINKKKMSFKDSYYLDMLPLKIETLEKELKEYETILSDRDLFKNDRQTFDKATTEITNIKKIINESENKWLELQILNDEINN